MTDFEILSVVFQVLLLLGTSVSVVLSLISLVSGNAKKGSSGQE